MTFLNIKARLATSHHRLTRREMEVLILIANDFTSKELADHLHISCETVKSHRCNLARKFGTKTAGGLIRRAFDLGILQVAV